MSRTHLRRPAAHHGWQEADRQRADRAAAARDAAKTAFAWLWFVIAAVVIAYTLYAWLGGAL